MKETPGNVAIKYSECIFDKIFESHFSNDLKIIGTQFLLLSLGTWISRD